MHALNRLLRWLSLVSGLKVNRAKSKLYGVGVPDSEVESFARRVNCGAGSLPFTYLGIPIGVNMKRAKFWKPVLDRFLTKLSRWKANHLSFAGRMTLAKSVLGSLPSYFLSLFSAPKCIIQKLEKIRRDFLWGKSNSGYKMRWIRWDYIMKAKKLGGMGMGSISGFNQAMLTKWWWRYKTDPNQLWASVVDAIHKGNSNSIQSIIPLKKAIPGVWKDIGSVESSLDRIGIKLSDNLVADGENWIWRSDPNGSFSIKQVRMDIDLASSGSDNNNEIVFGWNSWAIPKANYLLWRVQIRKIASKSGLIRRGVPLGDSLCSRCGMYEEDEDHIFLNCLWSRSIWWNILVWMRISFPSNAASFKDLASFLQNQPGGRIWKRIVVTVVMATTWRIWLARNDMTFEGKFVPIVKSVDLIKEDAFFWLNNRSKLKALNWEKWSSFDISESL
ncbi:putative reverse transcriptase zinc-binding domain-containing protein [Helianthus debilis subsp. tardiflorus]